MSVHPRIGYLVRLLDVVSPGSVLLLANMQEVTFQTAPFPVRLETKASNINALGHLNNMLRFDSKLIEMQDEDLSSQRKCHPKWCLAPK